MADYRKTYEKAARWRVSNQALTPDERHELGIAAVVAAVRREVVKDVSEELSRRYADLESSAETGFAKMQLRQANRWIIGHWSHS